MAVTKTVSRAHVEQELTGIEPWAACHGWSILWDQDRLLLVVLMRSAVDGERYIFEFNLDNYRELPPLIELVHPETGEAETRRSYPAGGRSYFHGKPVICAPWNRAAYQVHGGPHSDWAMTDWASYRPNHGRLSDILVLLQELIDDRVSYTGRMEG
jgi:hypothetical protein